MLRRVRVINTGKRVRIRLGVPFYPGKPVEMEVNRRGYVALKAVKDFEVKVLEGEEPEKTAKEGEAYALQGQETEKEEKPEHEGKAEKWEYEGKSVKEVLKAVREGKISPHEALTYELAGQNRKSLVDELKEMIAKKG